MTSFTIIGTGNMGGAIGGLLAGGGNDVTHLGREQATIAGEVVILAVPHSALASIVSAYGAQLVGKVVVDITNPLDFETFDSLVVPDGSSSAAELQAQLPDSKVLKAFNTNFASTLAAKSTGPVPTTVLIAGDDAEAKGVLAAAITAGGVSAIDAGSLARAHELEAMGFLQLTLAVGEQLPWTAGFAIAR